MARRTKRKISRSRLPLQRQLGLETEGRYFDLRGLFNKLNARHFGNRLRGYKVVWGRKRRERPKEYFIFGTIQEEDRVIRINPWLDQKFVPLWFLEYILYHEMLHAVVPDRAHGNRARIPLLQTRPTLGRRKSCPFSAVAWGRASARPRHAAASPSHSKSTGKMPVAPQPRWLCYDSRELALRVLMRAN